ncbi:precorrin-8X/cobalt-precorrin-8 methylmutase [Aurantimonas endophytica]|uniref:Precorrin-8X/cobalt-precorrin-8 methylmutase n=1 Tax=Aurantimonas endophytica TaxID=1522175 RepID=A0A7W6HC53_9HYPH|nr:precorrin-8X/cobalt-precorrin-8 methylmutase [Aurantimonas endophytica]MCO6403396.1 precorrin-8X methylmutase [Aurantimonas endophytica]
MSALFDRYAIVDWSASNAPARGKDSIWIAFAEREGTETRLVETLNPPTRAAAMARLEAYFRQALADEKRVFAGFDFPFGYPAGGAAAIAGSPDWRALWGFFADALQDLESNTNNRFEVAGRLNREQLAGMPMYWGRPMHQVVPGLSATKPDPYPAGLPEKRVAEARAGKAQPVWKLNFTGSVGSQAITGIARLEQLRRNPEFADHLAVWPFETRFASALTAPIVLAEIYPGLIRIEQGDKSAIDEAQVETLATIFSRFDADGRFGELLAAPTDLPADQAAAVVAEEGWIVGLGHRLAEALGEDDPEAYVAPGARLNYLRDPDAIYAESFRLIRAETDLTQLPDDAQDLAIRLVHACGMPEIVADLLLSQDAIAAGKAALAAGAPILCDSEMVAHGVIPGRLPQQNKIVCRLSDPRTRRIAERDGTTRSAAQVDLWSELMEGAVVAIGNAPTALFRLLERLDEGAPRPALIIGMPVGFVGAAESKAELVRDSRGIPYVTIAGRRGGSAMAAAAVNALAKGLD